MSSLSGTNQDICFAERVIYTDKDQQSEELEHSIVGQKVLLVNQVLECTFGMHIFTFLYSLLQKTLSLHMHLFQCNESVLRIWV